MSLFWVAAALAMAIRALWSDRTAFATVCVLAAALPAGYLVAAWRTQSTHTVSLTRPASLDVEGRVTMVEGRTKGHRLTMDRIEVVDRKLDAVPGMIRVGVAKGADGIVPGDRIRLRVRLEAPQPPALQMTTTGRGTPGSRVWAASDGRWACRYCSRPALPTAIWHHGSRGCAPP